MMSRFMTNYLGVNTVPGQQPPQAHPQQQPHHGLQLNPVALAQHPPSQQSAAQGQQSQMKSQSHTEHYTTPVMSQQNQQMHGPQTNAPHYRIVQSAPSSAFQQSAGPMQGPPQNQNQQHSQQISGNAMRGMPPPSSSTPPQQQQADVLTKMGQHYQMSQMPPPSQPPNPSQQQSRGGGYRPPSNINNRNRINPQHTPLIYNYTPPFVVPQVN